tara:strand:+ start:1784 stop:2620 length:837 start_codon:yes stop_codon:yes gene_type:complete
LVKESSLRLIDTNYIIVNTSVASIYKKSTFSSELITQALIWEKLIVIDKKNNWYKVRQNDNYEGWIHSFYTVDSKFYDQSTLLQDKKNWYLVKDKFLSVQLENKSKIFLSYGSLIPCFNDKAIFYVILPDGRKCVINKNSIIPFNHKLTLKDIINFSIINLMGIPYLWGGKSSFGFDCSGLLQAILTMAKIKDFPRDTSQQILSNTLSEKNNKPKLGDVIFFKSKNAVDHVGLYINEEEFIHSSGFVKINSIIEKNQYYSNKLRLIFFKVYEINVNVS